MDANSDFVSDAEIYDVLNEAQLDLASRLKCLTKRATSTTSGNTITIPADYLDMLTLRLGTTDTVEWVDVTEWNAWSDGGETPRSTLGRIFNDTIYMYPTPTTGTAYVLDYYQLPAVMTTGTDEPEVNEALQLKMLDYARSYIAEKEKDYEQATYYKTRYEDGLPVVPGLTTNEAPGPIAMSFAAGPFDTADAKHI